MAFTYARCVYVVTVFEGFKFKLFLRLRAKCLVVRLNSFQQNEIKMFILHTCVHVTERKL